MNPPTCTYPIGTDDHPCRKRAVAVYRGKDGYPYWRCRLHDGPKVRAAADEKGIARLEVAA